VRARVFERKSDGTDVPRQTWQNLRSLDRALRGKRQEEGTDETGENVIKMHLNSNAENKLQKKLRRRIIDHTYDI